MEFLSEYGLFLAKTVTVVVGLLVIVGALVSARHRRQAPGKGEIQVTNIGDDIKSLANAIHHEVMTKAEYKHFHKQEKQQEKAEEKRRKAALKKAPSRAEAKSEADTGHDMPATQSAAAESGDKQPPKRIYVLDFDGDVKASEVESLREEITAIIAASREGDEVLLRLESPGGMVHTYGLAASQLRRLRQHGLKLTVAVDEVAASGGYMMACVADEILAAPFAVLGSIGVVAEVPNFHRLLEKANVDYELHTAGEYKRTLTMFGENSPRARQKFREELDETHDLFKAFIRENRPQLDVESVATGEHWYGVQALSRGLVDKIQTSDDFLLKASEEAEIFGVEYDIRKPLAERLSVSLQEGVDRLLMKWWQRGSNPGLYK